jgi:hypothetical protein
MLDLAWSKNGPMVNLRFGVGYRFAIDVDLKILKMRTDLFEATVDYNYKINYSGVLFGDEAKLGFLGELYDPTNLDIHVDINVPGVAGDVKGAIDWLINKVVVGILRLLVVFVLVVATWEFAISLLLPSLGGGGAPMRPRAAGYVQPKGKEVTIAVRYTRE